MTEKKILLIKFLDEGRMEILDSDMETDCTNIYLIDEWAENVMEVHQSVCDSGLDISLCEGECRDIIIIRKTDMELLLGYCRDLSSLCGNKNYINKASSNYTNLLFK